MSQSAFNTPWFNNQDRNFFNHLNKPTTQHLIITGEDDEFDEAIEEKWRGEGFNTAYVAMGQGGAEFIQRVHRAGEGFGTAEYYGIVGNACPFSFFFVLSLGLGLGLGIRLMCFLVAFGDAASAVLEAHTKPNHPKLCVIVAYYPSIIPPPNTKYPLGVKILVHLAGSEVGVRQAPEVLGIQSTKKRTTQKRIEPGAGYGGSLNWSYLTYTYSAQPGFAESDLDEYDAAKETIAFSRSLRMVRKGFRIDVDADIERVRDNHYSLTMSGQAEKVVKQADEYAQVMYGPTLSGGVGQKDMQKFYAKFFQPLPKTFSARLLSRTVGSDQIVDELFVTMTHSQEIHWLLPGIPATDKKIEIILVSIVCIRGGGLESEHVYWDQASVLMQVGLLSPTNIPSAMKKKGVEELPIVGAEAARAIQRGSSRHLNELILDWDEDS
ncbi:Hypothetical protein R9X50_00717500 [Acrodontium crateriforme]|uniref:Dienelactone hydrolase n=1 Tax=Acrodontium crateriforme TaxID=150365 RepID=A0AAQ3MCN4_9PEZI|nr:Hypothetical protein R9X50_00717500 [Acrodontium crateriforme]